jgi:two-component system NtrC family sensor kinase
VHRTLRFQLTAIVVGTVATVLAVSQWLDTSLSERALERNLKERAFQALGTVDALWGRSDPEAFSRALGAMLAGTRELGAVDVFRLDPGGPVVAATTRTPEDARRAVPATADLERLVAGGSIARPLPAAGRVARWRLALPLQRDGAVVAVAQADLSLAEVAALQRGLRRIDGAMLGGSVLLISCALTLFLERRVARPVAALVAGMQRAEAGALDARVTAGGAGEFTFLGRSLNRMLARVEELTTGLEARVRQATRDLAAKNEELEAVNARLSRAQLEIARSERLAALGQLAATIAHELGTPLNSVLGYTQLLRREPLPAGAAEKLAIVESQVQRMVDTIRSVLDRTRERAPRRTPVAVDAVVAEAVLLVQPRLGAGGVALRRDVPADLPPVPADAVGLRQVLLNLLTNAIDAAGAGGTVTVRATVLAGNGRAGACLELAVADTGPGLRADDVARVFEPFYTTKAPGRGTGLGLAIVDHVVRAHGGEVVVDSPPGGGTVMRVRLPLDAA